MPTHFSILAWRIPWTEEPGGLQSTASQKSQAGLSNYRMVEINQSERIKEKRIKRNEDNLRDPQDIVNATTFES